MSADLIHVIEQIGREKGIERNVLIETVGAALLSASRKTLGGSPQDLRVEFDEGANTFRLYAVRKVVEVVTNPRLEISLEESRALDPQAELEQEVRTELPMSAQGFGRIAAQTAKQVIIQRVREAERDSLFQGFKDREGELITGVVQRVVKGNVIVNLGKAEALLPPREQTPREDYRVGDRIRAYIVDVKRNTKGSQVVLSRTHPGLLMKLFEMEVPEIAEGIVEIKQAAREPGERAKMAVFSKDRNVDPVGACVGYRGARVQSVVRELSGEKVDIILWQEDPGPFAKNALAPAEVKSVTVDEPLHTLRVVVADDQLSLAIGKRGQNARLAAKLVGWKVDISSLSEVQKAAEAPTESPEGEAAPPAPQGVEDTADLQTLPGVGPRLAERLLGAGYSSVASVAAASSEALQAIEGVGEKTAEKLIAAARAAVSQGSAESHDPDPSVEG